MKTVVALCFGAAICAASMAAQSTDQAPDFNKLVKSTQNIGVLGNGLAGDSTNFYTGGTTFSAVDLSIPGNNSLPVAVGRSYQVEVDHMVAEHSGGKHVTIAETKQFAFGDWDLDIPYLQGAFSQQYGWQLKSTTPMKRCSVIGQINADGTPATGRPLAQTQPSPSVRQAWTGYTLHTGTSDQSLLVATNATTPRPTTGGPYHWTTNKDWWVSCTATAANDAGEGFLATSPDGTRYRFDWVSRRNINALEREIDLDGQIDVTMSQRADVFMLPTHIEDRFGNWVDYTYSADTYAKLMSVTSNDGRQLALTYNAQGFVDTLSDGIRTVQYGYTDGRLTSVTLPDGTAWHYDFAALNQLVSVLGEFPPDCYYPPYTVPYTTFICENLQFPQTKAYVTHPGGAQIEFSFAKHFHLIDPQGFAEFPLGIVEKTISGPGAPVMKWYYTFGPFIPEARAQCQTGHCPARAWTDEVSPEFRVTRRMFGLEQYADQGVLLQELHGLLPVSAPVITQPAGSTIPHSRRGSDIDIVDDGSTVVLANTTNTVTGPPQFTEEIDYFYRVGALVGTNPLRDTKNSQVFWSERRMPIQTKTTQLQEATFSYQVNSWDGFDRPLSTTRSSTASP